MNAVTPEMIAYISVQVSPQGLLTLHMLTITTQSHYVLSDIRSWTDINHCSFNYTKFFNNIVKLFDNRDSPWVRETLEYVTR